jgi:hypothetical protein
MARLEGESIYRRVSLRMHADEKVRKLSKPEPCGLALWHELIFGEQTDIIPGLFRIGELAFAEQLGWSLKGFRDAWKELDDAGLAVRADWSARLVWVQNAIHHNGPKNQNQVLHWRDAWELLPECDLKRDAEQFIELYLEQLGEQFTEAFRRIRRNSSRNSSGNKVPFLYQQTPKSGAVAVAVAGSGDDHRSKSGESEGRESTACESVDNPEHIPANLSESERSHVLTLFRDGKATEARDYLASLQGGRGIQIQKKSGSGGVS